LLRRWGFFAASIYAPHPEQASAASASKDAREPL
jgi:hypothetical protein